jgi:hypothetical protein
MPFHLIVEIKGEVREAISQTGYISTDNKNQALSLPNKKQSSQ